MARILVIDDDATVGMTLTRMLQLDGHVVSRAETAQDGFDQAAATRPDAIILDMRMPAMGGLDFLRRLRGLPGLEQLPVGIVTGDYFLDEQIIGELGALGAHIRYKPVWMDELSALMRALLEARA